MANQDAWSAGWDFGSSRASGKPKPKTKDSGGDDSKTPTNGKGGTGGQTYFHKTAPSKAAPGSGSSGGGGNPWSILPIIKSSLGFGGSKKKGGPIRKTGLYLLHRNEYVVPAKHRSTKKASHKHTITKR
jgi:hypothetical protein